MACARTSSAQLVFGFVAGFLATVIFHQLALALLWDIGMAPAGSFSDGRDSTVGRAGGFFVGFLGRVWQILFALVQRRFPPSCAYWVAAFLFGAILPSVVALMLVLPLSKNPWAAVAIRLCC